MEVLIVAALSPLWVALGWWLRDRQRRIPSTAVAELAAQNVDTGEHTHHFDTLRGDGQFKELGWFCGECGERRGY